MFYNSRCIIIIWVASFTFRSDSVAQISRGQYVEGLNSVAWDKERRQTLENTLNNSTQNVFCTSDKVSSKTYILPNLVNKFISSFIVLSSHTLVHNQNCKHASCAMREG